MSQPKKIVEVAITVSSLDTALPFYKDFLNFKILKEYSLQGKQHCNFYGIERENLEIKVVELQLGDEKIALQEFVGMNYKPIPEDSKSNDLWFQHVALVVTDIHKAHELLVKNKVKIVSKGPQKLPEYLVNAAGIEAFYFEDLDGHILECISFPEDKGNPKWKKESNNLFLGIDHTAIGISNTAKSAHFYNELLGLKKAGESENYGAEQEALNNVEGAHLQITGNEAQEGFGLEFLEYLKPEGGRKYPIDSKPNDLIHWYTHIEVESLEKVLGRLRKTDALIISKDILEHKNKKYILLRDPDFHVVLLTEQPS